MINSTTTIDLTQNDIIRVVHRGSARHSDLATAYIERIKSELDIDAVAVYGLNYTQLALDGPIPEQKRGFFKKEIVVPRHHFEKKIDITVYVRNEIGKPKPFAVEYDISDRMAKIFNELLLEMKIELPFRRSFIPEEMELYGFNSKKPNSWDMSRIIQPEGDVAEFTSVRVEGFDSLAMWHIMNDSLFMISNINRIKNKFSGTVKYEFDHNTNEINHIVSVYTEDDFEAIKYEFFNHDLHDRMYNIVKIYDKWGVLSKENYRPTFTLVSKTKNRSKS